MRRGFCEGGWSSNWPLPCPCLVKLGIGHAAVAGSLALVGLFGTLRGPSWPRASAQLIPAGVVGGNWQRRLKPGVGQLPLVCEPVPPCGSTDRTASLRFGRSYSHTGSCVAGVCVVSSLNLPHPPSQQAAPATGSQARAVSRPHNLSDFGDSSPPSKRKQTTLPVSPDGDDAESRKDGPETKREPRHSLCPRNRG